MRIDAHQHFWRYSAEEYGWIGPGMAVLERDHLPGDLAPLLEGARVGGTVAVQARQTLAETAWLLELAAEHEFIKGVVGWVDLCGPDLRAQLERFGSDPGFRGVRHVVQDEADEWFMLRDEFLHGIRALAEFDLTYDILIYAHQLPVACEMVARFPEQPFVLDHIAKPLIKDGVLEPWASGIKRLAAYSNVACKVSGMVTEADWSAWQPAQMQPYLDAVCEAFGPDRILFGSDWPVCTLAGSYEQVIGLVSDFVGQLSVDEQTAVLGENARKFYNLE
jgi:L-fuconolactonase